MSPANQLSAERSVRKGRWGDAPRSRPSGGRNADLSPGFGCSPQSTLNDDQRDKSGPQEKGGERRLLGETLAAYRLAQRRKAQTTRPTICSGATTACTNEDGEMLRLSPRMA